MSSILYLILFLLQITFTITKPIPFKPCGDNNMGQVTKLEVFPDVIRPGTDYVAKITFNNTWSSPVVGGVSVTVAYYLGLPVGTYRSDLCEINESG